MRTNYNDSSNRNNGRYPKRQNGGGGGGRRPSGGGSGGGSGQGRRNPGQNSVSGGTNVAGMTSARNKYLEMAKEALSNGNRVEAENYYQHAEHYSKMLNAAVSNRRERDEAQHPHQRRNNNNGTNAETQQGEVITSTENVGAASVPDASPTQQASDAI